LVTKFYESFEMKKAVIATGGKQYLVSEGETLEVELIGSEQKTFKLKALLVIDGDKVEVGRPIVEGPELIVEVVDPDLKADKVTAIRYKAKKRVHKLRGHRQHFTRIKINKIAT